MKMPEMHELDSHDEMGLLLPWYVNGTLDATESARVRAHLRGCSRCRDEVAAQRELRAHLTAMPPVSEIDTDLALGKFMARIREESIATRQASAAGGNDSRRSLGVLLNWFVLPGQRPLVWAGAVALLALAILPLASDLGSPVGSNVFHTAASPGSYARFEANDIRVVFAQPLTAEAIQSIVESLQGRVVDGPTGPGVYTIRFDAQDPSPDFVAERLDRLRERADVAFAAPAIPVSDPHR